MQGLSTKEPREIRIVRTILVGTLNKDGAITAIRGDGILCDSAGFHEIWNDSDARLAIGWPNNGAVTRRLLI
jgi:hypothetical protein